MLAAHDMVRFPPSFMCCACAACEIFEPFRVCRNRPIAKLPRWKEERLFTARAAPVMLPRHRVQDIDTPEDWRRAEMLWRLLESERQDSA